MAYDAGTSHTEQDPELSDLRGQRDHDKAMRRRLSRAPHCCDPDHPGCRLCEDQPEDEWSNTPPDVPGTYLMRCNEGDWAEEQVSVYFRADGILMADDPQIGTTSLESLHDGLTGPQWKLFRSEQNPLAHFNATSHNPTAPGNWGHKSGDTHSPADQSQMAQPEV